MDGSFFIKPIKSGNFIILITHPGFSDQWKLVTINPSLTLDLRAIRLLPRSSMLQEVIVTQHRPLMHLRGDTLEYNVVGVKTKNNASVEDLLKQLPGVTVDRKGEITAQGEKIQKVLVDGEEFFSDDPTIATRDLSASMVGKVQIFNKKSVQAEFTGIDDGKSIKTLNLALRDDSKQGWFGKAEAGTNANQYYNGNALAGTFKSSRKFSVFGLASNTAQSYFSVGDAQGLDDGDNISIPQGPIGDNNFGVSGASGGIPKNSNAGIHYSNRWNGDGVTSGQHLTVNYRYSGLLNNANSYTFIQETLPDSLYTQIQRINSFSTKEQHTLFGVYQVSFDSSSSFQFLFGGLKDQFHNQDVFTDTTRLNNILVNNNYRSSDAHIKDRNTIGDISWRKKFRHPEQTLLTNIFFRTIDQYTEGYLYSFNNYQRDTTSLFIDSTDQKKNIHIQISSVTANAFYTNQLGTKASFGIGYALSLMNNQSVNNTWNKGNGKYDEYVDSLSSQYLYKILTQKLSLFSQGKVKHFNYNIGGEISYAIYRQKDILQDTSLQYHYFNLFPSLSVHYQCGNAEDFSFSYNGNTQQPSIYQIQPEKNNNDPLNILAGNSNLQPAFSHNFRLLMSNFNTILGRTLNVALNFGFITNSISSRSTIDSLGRTVTQSINVNGNKNFGITTSSSLNIHSLNLQLELNMSIAYNRMINFVNSLENFNGNYISATGFSISRYVPDKYNFKIGSTFNYTYSLSSINKAAPTMYWSQGYIADAGLDLPGNIDFSTNAIFTWRQKINASDINNQFLLWNLSFNKHFAKNTLTSRLSLNDILNQNKGFSTSINANEIIQSTNTTTHRYWLLSIIWNFTSHPKP